MKKNLKNSITMPKKIERETLWDFSTSILCENMKKLKGDPLMKVFFENKMSQGRNYSEGVPFGPVEFLR